MMKKYLFPLFILLLFISNIQFIYGAACYPTCTPTPCPDLQAGTEIGNIELNPDSSIFIEVEQCCANPYGIDTAEEWAGYFGVSANNGEDKDIRIDKYWEQKEPACACVLKTKDPAEIFDIIYKKWEFCESPIDLTTPGQYYLKHIWYNKVRKDQYNNCVINYVDGEKNRIKVINVNYFAPEVDPLPSPGNPVYDSHEWYDCYEEEAFGDGTLSATPYWAHVGTTVNSPCGEKCILARTISINVSTNFQVGVKYVIVAIIGGGLSETESFYASSECSAIPLKRRQLKCYQKGYYSIGSIEWGSYTYDEQELGCVKSSYDTLEINQTIWKNEIMYNCATYAVTPPS